MSALQVSRVTIDNPIFIAGKMVQGDYAKSYEYVSQVQKELADASVPFIQQKVIGIYYDNPQEKKTEDMRSFHGVFISNDILLPDSLIKMSLHGNYLYVKATGDIMKSIYDGYNALFAYIRQHNIKLKSPAGYQVATFADSVITTEIYMELAD